LMYVVTLPFYMFNTNTLRYPLDVVKTRV
jgi:hypothetical protein